MSAVAEARTMKITKIKEHIGAEVTGIDLREPIDEETRRRLYDAAVDNVALVIRGQKFDAAQYQAAAELFGELMEDQNRRYLVDGLPLVSVLSNRHKDSQGNPAKVGKNATWHTDHTNQERPPKFTMLYPVALPEKGGGTVFPDVSLEVAPKRGNGVFFSYDRPHAVTRTLHGGAPVLAGEKWIATKWLRERRFE